MAFVSNASQEAQLRAVGWTPSPGDSVAAAWARTATTAQGGTQPNPTNSVPAASSPGSPAAAPGVPGAPGGPTVTNVAANTALTNAAQQAAYQAYLNAKLNLDTDDLAFKKATQAFADKMSEAAVTGTYNGQQTQAAQAQQFSQAQATAGITGMYNGAPTLAAQAQQQKTANDYLTLISNLRGPQDYGQYLKTLGSTPGGMRDLVASAAGQYAPSAGSTSGYAPTPASLGGLVGAVGGQGGGMPVSGASLTGDQKMAIQKQMEGQLGQGGWGGAAFDAALASGTSVQAAITAGAGGRQVSMPTLPQMGAPAGAATAGDPYGQYMATAAGLPAPNQIAPAAFNTYTDTQKKMLLGMYEAQGWNPADVTDLYKQSLPKYAGPAGAGTVKLA